mmetsp:Transcript_41405/g.104010  ORF Transcript_41405/g.104010 Transcript_41405/m.104010 type:complete len:204 (-) Transcript_41405:1271-1882(-)
MTARAQQAHGRAFIGSGAVWSGALDAPLHRGSLRMNTHRWQRQPRPKCRTRRRLPAPGCQPPPRHCKPKHIGKPWRQRTERRRCRPSLRARRATQLPMMAAARCIILRITLRCGVSSVASTMASDATPSVVKALRSQIGASSKGRIVVPIEASVAQHLPLFQEAAAIAKRTSRRGKILGRPARNKNVVKRLVSAAISTTACQA